jgi:hypothetical protein
VLIAFTGTTTAPAPGLFNARNLIR